MPLELLLGNEAIALGLLEAGCEVVTAYPGTPATEVLQEVARRKERHGLDTYVEWSVNEKVAFDVALAASWVGRRAATAMKQVGLNVASDSVLSAAYTGVRGGLLLIACDDPGPHSSQTEQDSRLFALFAKLPALDPSDPSEARALARYGVDLSERHGLPVLLRPTTRVCHARQPIEPGAVEPAHRAARFERDPQRLAATPRFRLALHGELNRKLAAVRAEFEALDRFNREEPGEGRRAIIASGAAWATAVDALREIGARAPVLKVATAFPLPVQLVSRFIGRHDEVLVLEEPDAAIELQLPDRTRVRGRLTGDVPPEGELGPDVVRRIILRFLGREAEIAPTPEAAPGAAPRLCPGCGHRAAFYAIRVAVPDGIYTSDIGCYTLGLNQRAVDTCLDMGASVSLASGFRHALARDGGGRERPIVATIGDSTFLHAGIPALVNAHATGARFVLVILDNGVVAMTGHQPTPATGRQADGRAVPRVDIRRIVEGVGVGFVEEVDPYDVARTIEVVRRARAFAERPDGGVAVVIARHPCALLAPPDRPVPVRVCADRCNGCGACLRLCECPALAWDEAARKVGIDFATCVDCGVCIATCPHGAIVAREPEP